MRKRRIRTSEIGAAVGLASGISGLVAFFHLLPQSVLDHPLEGWNALLTAGMVLLPGLTCIGGFRLLFREAVVSGGQILLAVISSYGLVGQLS